MSGFEDDHRYHAIRLQGNVGPKMSLTPEQNDIFLSTCDLIKVYLFRRLGKAWAATNDVDEMVNIAAVSMLSRIDRVDFTRSPNEVGSYLFQVGRGAVWDHFRTDVLGGRVYHESNLIWDCPVCGFHTNKWDSNGMNNTCVCGTMMVFANKNPVKYLIDSLENPDEVDYFAYEDNIEAIDIQSDVRAAVEALPEKQRVMLTMILNDYRQKDVAKFFKVTEGAISHWMKLAQALLRDRLMNVAASMGLIADEKAAA